MKGHFGVPGPGTVRIVLLCPSLTSRDPELSRAVAGSQLGHTLHLSEKTAFRAEDKVQSTSRVGEAWLVESLGVC